MSVFTLDDKNIQLRLKQYLENEKWTEALDNSDIDTVFKLTNPLDYLWLCAILESNGETIPAAYDKLRYFKIDHIDKNSFKRHLITVDRDNNPKFDLYLELSARIIPIKFISAVYFTDKFDDYIDEVEVDIESFPQGSLKEIRNLIKPLEIHLNSDCLYNMDLKNIGNYPDVTISCYVEYQYTSIRIPDNIYADVGPHYQVDFSKLIDAINKIIDILNSIY